MLSNYSWFKEIDFTQAWRPCTLSGLYDNEFLPLTSRCRALSSLVSLILGLSDGPRHANTIEIVSQRSKHRETLNKVFGRSARLDEVWFEWRAKVELIQSSTSRGFECKRVCNPPICTSRAYQLNRNARPNGQDISLKDQWLQVNPVCPSEMQTVLWTTISYHPVRYHIGPSRHYMVL